MHFDPSTLRMRGARITAYLLEKSRVVSPSAGERSYHAFYFLLAGSTPDQRRDLFLSEEGAAAYRILNRGGCLAVEGQDDAAEHAQMLKALATLRFDDHQIAEVLRVLAALLHVGNVEFEPDADGEGVPAGDSAAATAPAAAAAATSPSSGASGSGSGTGDAARYRIASAHTSLAHACALLSLDAAQVARALTTRQLRIAGGESITVFHSAVACADNRDALAKTLYEALFLRLLAAINDTLQLHSPPQPRVIGVLDIFGQRATRRRCRV